VAETLDTPRLRICALCGRGSGGFFYTHQLRPDRFPTFAFCSLRCLDAGNAIARRSKGLIDKTDIEARAIKAARRYLAEVLNELGLMAPFRDRSAEEIDRVIEACIDGFQDAMRRHALNDDIPF
jgi:hypothetical protein